MKKYIGIIQAVAVCTGLAVTAFAPESHDHEHIATPKGGRLLEKTQPHAEFVVEKDRTATINFYNDQLKPVPVSTQTAGVVAGKEKIEFEKQGDSLVSKTKLPEGDRYNVVVQFRQTSETKPQNYRFKMDLSTCGECKRAEYACACHH